MTRMVRKKMWPDIEADHVREFGNPSLKKWELITLRSEGWAEITGWTGREESFIQGKYYVSVDMQMPYPDPL